MSAKVDFQDSQSKNKFQSFMLDAYNALTSIQADQAEKQLDVLIEKGDQCEKDKVLKVMVKKEGAMATIVSKPVCH